MTSDTTGVVVAGGRSTRFGDREKALAEVGGQPMLCRVVAALGALTDEVVVNCRPDQRAAFGEALTGFDVRWALDEATDEGPLVGLLTGLGAVETEFAVVLGCDMPLVEREALGTLLATARTSDADAVVPVTDGGPEPLHAVYRVGPTRAAARATVDDGRRSLHAMVAALSVETVPVGTAVPARSVTSVDTAKRWRELAAASDE